jgi:hypothetical protein
VLSALWLSAWAGILADLIARVDGGDADGDGVEDAVHATGLVPVLLLAAAVLAVIIPLPERCAADVASRAFFAELCKLTKR